MSTNTPTTPTTRAPLVIGRPMAGKISTRKASDAIAQLRPFATYGALSAVATGYGLTGGGYYGGVTLGQFPRDRAVVDSIYASPYVVLSYSTPIGWVVADGEAGPYAVVPSYRYSVTTSRHQTYTRAGFHYAGLIVADLAYLLQSPDA